jgi:hypothetical protein
VKKDSSKVNKASTSPGLIKTPLWQIASERCGSKKGQLLAIGLSPGKKNTSEKPQYLPLWVEYWALIRLI